MSESISLLDSIKKTILVYEHNLSIGAPTQKLFEIATIISLLVEASKGLGSCQSTNEVVRETPQKEQNIFVDEITIESPSSSKQFINSSVPKNSRVVSGYFYEDGFQGKDKDYFRNS